MTAHSSIHFFDIVRSSSLFMLLAHLTVPPPSSSFIVVIYGHQWTDGVEEWNSQFFYCFTTPHPSSSSRTNKTIKSSNFFHSPCSVLRCAKDAGCCFNLKILQISLLWIFFWIFLSDVSWAVSNFSVDCPLTSIWFFVCSFGFYQESVQMKNWWKMIWNQSWVSRKGK